MALPDLRDNLSCSICQKIYKDPVTLPCGHSFCSICINERWENVMEQVMCPECRISFQPRPQLTINWSLREIVDKFSINQEENGIFCSYCEHLHVLAVKTCLLCEASLCITHLNCHSKSKKHVLTEPTDDFENRKCSIHRTVLDCYCKKDDACICELCLSDGEHKGHQVEKLNEASENRKMILRNLLDTLIKYRDRIEERECWLRKKQREVNDKSEHQTKQVSLLLCDIMEQYEALEQRVLGEISWFKKRLSLPFTDQMKRLEIRRNEMNRKIHHIEELCNMVNPVTILDEWNSGGAALCFIEGGDNEDRGREDLQALDLEQMDQSLETLVTGLNGIVAEFPKDRTQMGLRNVCSFVPQGCVVPPMNTMSSANVTLDISTAASNVVVSGDKKSVSHSKTHHCYPESPDRFQESQVLSTSVFTSGQHSWKVEVSEMGEVRIGVAYTSIARKGFQSYIGENTKSWCLYIYETSNTLQKKQHKFSGRHGSKEIIQPYKISCRRLGVYLDYEAGNLSFYELCNPFRHLHTFTATFTEPLHAAFCVWGDASVTILS